MGHKVSIYNLNNKEIVKHHKFLVNHLHGMQTHAKFFNISLASTIIIKILFDKQIKIEEEAIVDASFIRH